MSTESKPTPPTAEELTRHAALAGEYDDVIVYECASAIVAALDRLTAAVSRSEVLGPPAGAEVTKHADGSVSWIHR